MLAGWVFPWCLRKLEAQEMYNVLCVCNCGHVWFGKSCGQISEIIVIMKAEDWGCGIRDM
jgi:hypothetical protein